MAFCKYNHLGKLVYNNIILGTLYLYTFSKTEGVGQPLLFINCDLAQIHQHAHIYIEIIRGTLEALVCGKSALHASVGTFGTFQYI